MIGSILIVTQCLIVILLTAILLKLDGMKGPRGEKGVAGIPGPMGLSGRDGQDAPYRDQG